MVIEFTAARYREGDEATLSMRRMKEDDLEAVERIEHASFPVPWSRQAFAYEVTESTISLPLVAAIAGTVCGYVVAWTVADELHIGTIAVHPAWRRRGVARLLLEEILRLARERLCRRAYLEVRRSNVAAQKLYKRLGFECSGVRRHYYAPKQEDALVMSRQFLSDEGENGLV